MATKKSESGEAKKTRTRRPLADRLKGVGADRLRAMAAKAKGELLAIGAEAKRREQNKEDLSDLAAFAE